MKNFGFHVFTLNLLFDLILWISVENLFLIFTGIHPRNCVKSFFRGCPLADELILWQLLQSLFRQREAKMSSSRFFRNKHLLKSIFLQTDFN